MITPFLGLPDSAVGPIIASIVTSIGIGTLIGIVIKRLLDTRSEIKLRRKASNEEKYRTILIYMSIVIDADNKKHYSLNDPVLYEMKDNSEVVSYTISKLKEYYYQSLLYASDNVVEAFKEFLKEKSRENYILCAQTMRQSLWDQKTKLNFDDIDIEEL
jgi:hypothetical protein